MTPSQSSWSTRPATRGAGDRVPPSGTAAPASARRLAQSQATWYLRSSDQNLLVQSEFRYHRAGPVATEHGTPSDLPGSAETGGRGSPTHRSEFTELPFLRLGELLGIAAALAILGYWGVSYALESIRHANATVEASGGQSRSLVAEIDRLSASPAPAPK